MTSATLRRIRVIDGHPDSDPNRYVHALAQRYVAGAEASGHLLCYLAICEMAFPLITDRKTWEGEDLPPAIHEIEKEELDDKFNSTAIVSSKSNGVDIDFNLKMTISSRGLIKLLPSKPMSILRNNFRRL